MTKLRRRRRNNNAEESSSSPTQLMNLSLFIMLLAFFIILNALSSFEEIKVNPVMNSLEQTFSTEVRRQDISPSVRPSPLESIHEGETVERLQALFNAQIRSFKSSKSNLRGTMAVEMDKDDFQDAMMAIGQQRLTKANSYRPPRRYFLPTLVSILQTDQMGQPYRFEMIFHTDNNPARLQNREPKAMNELINEAGQYAQRLEEIGLPQKLLNIGFREGNPDKVTLFFRRHIPFSPVDTPAEGDEN